MLMVEWLLLFRCYDYHLLAIAIIGTNAYSFIGLLLLLLYNCFRY